MANNTCVVSPNQERASAVAGNIGIVQAKAVVWDHDPFLARSTQQTAFAFSRQTGEQAKKKGTAVGALFEANGVCLQPTFTAHDMWVATINKGVLNMVGDPASGSGLSAYDKLPGGNAYEFGDPGGNWRVGKDMFPHQMWIQVGSILSKNVLIHPSEYPLPWQQSEAAQSLAFIDTHPEDDSLSSVHPVTVADIQNAPRWDLTPINDSVGSPFWPVQTQKSSSVPVHWTLQKLTDVWQGEDFFVTISKGNKKTDDHPDNTTPSNTSSVIGGLNRIDPNTGEEEIIDTDWDEYKYLLHNPKEKPDDWEHGISNAAFFVPELPTTAEENETNIPRTKFWWKYKTYILIEIGVGHPKHNYFIELVKDRNPRFLHLGEEWDNPNRLNSTVFSMGDFKMMKKCRELSWFRGVSCDELFSKDSFRISVRNHLNSIVITFSGYEHTPWTISRKDNIKYKFDFEKETVPMIVPVGKIRIHGGNISAAINFSPTEYTPTTMIEFNDVQAATHLATNEDIYMTFSHMGGVEKWTSGSFKRDKFGDKVGRGSIGYDSDAALITEIHQNNGVSWKHYEEFWMQYYETGKGWYFLEEIEVDLPGGEPPITDFIAISAFKTDNDKHHIEILNASDGGYTFKFGITDYTLTGEEDGTDEPYPYSDFVSKWDVAIKLYAGSPTLPETSVSGLEGGEAKFRHCITPIATSWRLVVVGGGKATDGVEPFDISPLITSISDSWNSEDYATLKHEMKLKCYIPVGQPAIGQDDKREDETIDIYALGQRLLSRIDKASFITVSYWWSDGIGEKDAIGNFIERGKGSPGDSPLLIQMTGIAYGAEIETSANKKYLNITIKDYTTVLENQFIWNSPFFDGVSDRIAVYELGRMAGFDDETNTNVNNDIDRSPLGYMKHIIDRRSQETFFYNGERNQCKVYDLPGSYATLANPAFRFNNGETYLDALKKISQVAGKTFYFDRWGVMKYETNPAFVAAVKANSEEFKFESMFDFVSTPIIPKGLEGTVHREEPFEFDPNEHASNLIYEVVTYSRSVEDCINQLIIFTASNDLSEADGSALGGLIVKGWTFFEQIWDTNAEGFLGFNKAFYQSNGVFGSVGHAGRGLDHYSRMKFPPASISFQTYGVPGLKALDIITVDNELFYITQIAHEIEPSANRWWMNISGEWLKPALGSLE